jgi:hypothetical protein
MGSSQWSHATFWGRFSPTVLSPTDQPVTPGLILEQPDVREEDWQVDGQV